MAGSLFGILAVAVAVAAALLIAAGGVGVGGCRRPDPAEAVAGELGAGPGVGLANGSYRFAFVTNNGSEFWSIAEKGVRKAEKDFGVKVEIFRPAKGELTDQQRLLEDVAAQGFDGVAISPINPDAMTESLNRVAAKMPLVCHDSDAPRSKRNVYVGTNNVDAGRVAGTVAIGALKAANLSRGKIAYFVGRMDVQNAIERKQGLDETLGKLAGFDVLPVFLDRADRALARKNADDALSRYPDLALGVALWSNNGPSLVEAMRAARRAVKPVLVTFDEDEDTLKAVADGLVSATIVQRPFQFGYQSIRALKELRDGKVAPPVVDTGILTVERENLPQFWAELRDLKR